MSALLKTLQEEIKTLKASGPAPGGVCGVSCPCTGLVRQLVGAPKHMRDPHMIMSAVQQLADEAKTSADPKTAEYEAILRQCRPIMYRGDLGEILTRLLGTKEESNVANTIAKMTKPFGKQGSGVGSAPYQAPPRRPFYALTMVGCYGFSSRKVEIYVDFTN